MEIVYFMVGEAFLGVLSFSTEWLFLAFFVDSWSKSSTLCEQCSYCTLLLVVPYRGRKHKNQSALCLFLLWRIEAVAPGVCQLDFIANHKSNQTLERRRNRRPT